MTKAEVKEQRIRTAKARNAEWLRLANAECPNRAIREVMLDSLTWNEYHRTVLYFGLDGGDPARTLRDIAEVEQVDHKAVQRSVDQAITKLRKNPHLWLRWLMLDEADPEGEDLRVEASDLRQLPSRGVLRPSGTKWSSDSERND